MKALLYSPLVLLDVADIVATHCAGAHVTDERKQLVLWRRGRRDEDHSHSETQYVNVKKNPR